MLVADGHTDGTEFIGPLWALPGSNNNSNNNNNDDDDDDDNNNNNNNNNSNNLKPLLHANAR